MIYTVTWNPALDYILHLENLQKGKIHRTSREEIYPGGKGINVSIVLSEFGVANKALGFLAGFTGREIEAQLKKYGCETEFLYTKEGMSRINVKVRAAEETDLNASGPKIEEAEIEAFLLLLDQLKKGDYLVLAGSVPPIVARSAYERILEKVSDKEVSVIVDAEGELLKRTLHYHPFLIKPNEEELNGLFSVTIKTKEDVVSCARRLQDLGARNVLVSLGEKGAILVTQEGKVMEQEAYQGTVKNTVGAGDSMVAGFLAGYLKKESFEEALRLAVRTGSASAFSEWLPCKDSFPQIFIDK